MTSLKSRVLVAVIGVPLLVAIVLWAPVMVLRIVVALLSAIGSYELLKCVVVASANRGVAPERWIPVFM